MLNFGSQSKQSKWIRNLFCVLPWLLHMGHNHGNNLRFHNSVSVISFPVVAIKCTVFTVTKIEAGSFKTALTLVFYVLVEARMTSTVYKVI